MSEIEYHPLKPFVPEGAQILLLGSFPPGHQKWSMEFFYPNFQNDMWRIIGLLFFGDKQYFVDGKRFDYQRVVNFCTQKKIGIFDTAVAVRRLKGNASDAFLEIVERTDLAALLASMPQCATVVSTGGKSAEEVSEQFGCAVPPVGSFIDIHFAGRNIRFYRMPSSSRAYPMKLEDKAACYSAIWTESNVATLA